MATKEIKVERFSVTSPKPFGEVVKALEASVGHPNMNTFMSDIISAKSFTDLEKMIHAATGPSGLMQFVRFDLGEIVRKERGDSRATKPALFDWQSAHHETDARAVSRCRIVCPGNDSGG